MENYTKYNWDALKRNRKWKSKGIEYNMLQTTHDTDEHMEKSTTNNARTNRNKSKPRAIKHEIQTLQDKYMDNS